MLAHKVYTRYYRKQLNDTEKKIYDGYLRGVESFKKSIKVDGIDGDYDVHKIILALNLDNPQLYYVDLHCKYCYTNKYIELFPNYYYTDSEYKKIKRIIEHEICNLEEQKMGKTDLVKVKEIHDRLVRRVTYGYIEGKEKEAHNIVGALKDFKCVCEGFAKLFKYLMDDLKVPCIVVFGDAFHPIDGSHGAHAWNIVRVNRVNYQIDVTWDHVVGEKYTSYAYYLLSDKDISFDHKPDSDFSVPICRGSFYASKYVDNVKDLIPAMHEDYLGYNSFSQYRLRTIYNGSDELYKEIKKCLTDRTKEMYDHIMRIWYGNKSQTLYVEWRR
ncbi:transglutaminase domain-containing protein [Eubacterium sp.]|uniref:transglutaminase domain-containing protein n=1 Tax=Eubacterium sp. TaxID=142586 RepID=UPI0025D66059|nr:transglutaminase domain-containing protein [Eubacterium sp.]MCR5629707.1 hypothetical protein [Eubacterium sp.]